MKKKDTLSPFPETAPYSISKELYREGFRAYQKKYVMPRNYIMMGIFAILAASMVAAAVSDPTNTLTYVLLMVCLAAIFMLWYNPRKQRRMILDVVGEMEQQKYTACCADNTLILRTVEEPIPERAEGEDSEVEELPEQIPPTILNLDECYVEILDNCFLVCQGKRMFYIVPSIPVYNTGNFPKESA